jgi:hypothetical protein
VGSMGHPKIARFRITKDVPVLRGDHSVRGPDRSPVWKKANQAQTGAELKSLPPNVFNCIKVHTSSPSTFLQTVSSSEGSVLNS